jgi:transposase, IS5 family
VNDQLEAKGLFVRQESILDATMEQSSNRPLSNKARETQKVQDSKQIDTDAHATKKGSTYYFGYKGHIGMDLGSNLIRTRIFTSANVAVGPLLEQLVDHEAGAVFADKAYADNRLKVMARQFGWYYGILDKHPVGGRLSHKQERRNKKISRISARVEHPFAWMKTQSKGLHARAKSRVKNAVSFDFSCMYWNLKQASLMLAKVK